MKEARAPWLGENEATISAVVGITALAGILFADLQRMISRARSAENRDKATAIGPEADSEVPYALVMK